MPLSSWINAQTIQFLFRQSIFFINYVCLPETSSSLLQSQAYAKLCFFNIVLICLALTNFPCLLIVCLAFEWHLSLSQCVFGFRCHISQLLLKHFLDIYISVICNLHLLLTTIEPGFLQLVFSLLFLAFLEIKTI